MVTLPGQETVCQTVSTIALSRKMTARVTRPLATDLLANKMVPETTTALDLALALEMNDRTLTLQITCTKKEGIVLKMTEKDQIKDLQNTEVGQEIKTVEVTPLIPERKMKIVGIHLKK